MIWVWSDLNKEQTMNGLNGMIFGKNEMFLIGIRTLENGEQNFNGLGR